jgi:hypothetical protein
LDSHAAAGTFVKTLPQDAVELSLFVQVPGLVVHSTLRMQSSVTLQLPSGPSRIKSVSWHVADFDMDEIVLGRLLLKALHLDVLSHFDQVRERFDNLNFSELTDIEGSGSLSRLMIQTEVSKPISAVHFQGDI